MHRAVRAGLTIVVSDFLDPRGFQAGIDPLRYHRHEPHLVHLFDEAEADPQLRGELELFDVETEVASIGHRQSRDVSNSIGSCLTASWRACGPTRGNKVWPASRRRRSVPFDDLILRMMRVSGNVA